MSLDSFIDVAILGNASYAYTAATDLGRRELIPPATDCRFFEAIHGAKGP
jgi:hypothetical protein